MGLCVGGQRPGSCSAPFPRLSLPVDDMVADSRPMPVPVPSIARRYCRYNGRPGEGSHPAHSWWWQPPAERMNAAGRQHPRDAATTRDHGPRGPHSSGAPTPDCPVGQQRRKSGDHGGRQYCSWQGEPHHERRVAGLAPTPNCPANTARPSGRPISCARPPAQSLASTPAPRHAGGIGQAPAQQLGTIDVAQVSGRHQRSGKGRHSIAPDGWIVTAAILAAAAT
jgi:hypothetical protein